MSWVDSHLIKMSWAHVDERWAWDANFVWRYPRDCKMHTEPIREGISREERWGGGMGLAFPKKGG